MLQFKYPGVYTQEIPSGARTISGAPTSVALFVGPTRTGIDNRPTRIQSFGDFERSFGGLTATSNLSYSVLHFFANGGGEAFIVRVPTRNAKAAQSEFKRNGANTTALTVTALSSGAASNALWAEFDPFDIGALPFDAVNANLLRFNLAVLDQASGRRERFGALEMASGNARSVAAVVNDIGSGSKLIGVSAVANGVNAPVPTGTILSFGALPTNGPGLFAKAVRAKLSLALLAVDGTADAASVADAVVELFPLGAPLPKSKPEFLARLLSALNAAIRADTTVGGLAAAMEGVDIEGQLFEAGGFVRLKAALPDTATVKRVGDVEVKLANDTSGGADGLLTLFNLVEKARAVSRVQLGATYPAASPLVGGTPVRGTDGDAAGQPDTAVFKAAVIALGTPDAFFNTLCLPDLVRPSASDPNALHHAAAMSIYGEAAMVCKKKFAFLVVDPFPGVNDVGAAEVFKSTGITFQSSHAAAFFPNIRVDDPLVPGAIRAHPPSGAIAGVIARIDGQVGVWQAPAGTKASLSGVYGPSVVLSDDEHGILNPLGLNCIRQFPIYGTVNFGSRTVDGANAFASEYKYIPVRRTANYILRSLSEALRWAVHEPNGEQLWSQLRVNTTAFMHGLFRQGAFKGVSARDAYFVMCDASTTTADDINNGIVNIVVGFAPLKPAEFVVISLRQIVQPQV